MEMADIMARLEEWRASIGSCGPMWYVGIPPERRVMLQIESRLLLTGDDYSIRGN